jgi:hypothetical protein
MLTHWIVLHAGAVAMIPVDVVEIADAHRSDALWPLSSNREGSAFALTPRTFETEFGAITEPQTDSTFPR